MAMQQGVDLVLLIISKSQAVTWQWHFFKINENCVRVYLQENCVRVYLQVGSETGSASLSPRSRERKQRNRAMPRSVASEPNLRILSSNIAQEKLNVAAAASECTDFEPELGV